MYKCNSVPLQLFTPIIVSQDAFGRALCSPVVVQSVIFDSLRMGLESLI